MSKAKKWVQRPHFRSRVERDRKKEEKRNPNDGNEWVIWEDKPIDKTDWPDLDLEEDKGGE